MLDIHPGDVIVDATLGGGGHSEEIIKRFGNTVRIIGLDLDLDALTRAEARLGKLGGNVSFHQENFRNLDVVLNTLKVPKVQKVILDLGWNAFQFDPEGNANRGFTFQKDEPLVMTFNNTPTQDAVTAYTILNEWSEETIATILTGYGEERYARRIASEIIKARVKPISTTFELVDIILKATPPAYYHRRIHPATKTFQALRIATNDELEALKEGLHKSFEHLDHAGRIAVISFHSLEDRIVKRFFKEKKEQGLAEVLTKKPVIAGDQELGDNRRARSAKLRVLAKN